MGAEIMENDPVLCANCGIGPATHVFASCSCMYCKPCKNRLCGGKNVEDNTDLDITCLVCGEEEVMHYVNPICPQKRCRHVCLLGPNKTRCFLITDDWNRGAILCAMCMRQEYLQEFSNAGCNMDPREPNFVEDLTGNAVVLNRHKTDKLLLEDPDDSAEDTVIQILPAVKFI